MKNWKGLSSVTLNYLVTMIVMISNFQFHKFLKDLNSSKYLLLKSNFTSDLGKWGHVVWVILLRVIVVWLKLMDGSNRSWNLLNQDQMLQCKIYNIYIVWPFSTITIHYTLEHNQVTKGKHTLKIQFGSLLGVLASTHLKVCSGHFSLSIGCEVNPPVCWRPNTSKLYILLTKGGEYHSWGF